MSVRSRPARRRRPLGLLAAGIVCVSALLDAAYVAHLQDLQGMFIYGGGAAILFAGALLHERLNFKRGRYS